MSHNDTSYPHDRSGNRPARDGSPGTLFPESSRDNVHDASHRFASRSRIMSDDVSAATSGATVVSVTAPLTPNLLEKARDVIRVDVPDDVPAGAGALP